MAYQTSAKERFIFSPKILYYFIIMASSLFMASSLRDFIVLVLNIEVFQIKFS